MRSLVRLPFLLYRALISPLIHLIFGPDYGCRFEPTCSRYTQQATEQHGAAKGSLLGVKRLCRCHPFAKGGFDPVPERGIESSSPRKVSSNGP